ncbi:hypothetical protein Agub_g4344 [Astrephomene gubernaculifera]|uniref:Uncharacterized protein n=1 Tax=Astrephomene gubernaculifera TaxID=47775 RepID=A0AAD3HJ54_9CHLO|nr:hypothetical protein Agub_g4344 [Astrephomene gubernaculifera]
MDGPQLSDQQLRELGVTFHEPTLPAIRETVVIEGRRCRVFRSEAERKASLEACKVEVVKNCLNGARSSCVMKAMDTCRGPAWRRWLPFLPGAKDPRNMEACEARVVEECLSGAAEGCTTHAAQLCAQSHPSRMWLE